MSETKSEANGVAAIIATVSVGALIFGMACAEGFVVAKLWGWFVVPFGIPAIGYAWAVGLSILFGILGPPTPSNDSSWWRGLGKSIFRYALALLAGYIAHLFM